MSNYFDHLLELLLDNKCSSFVALQLFREVKIMKMLDHPNIGTVQN